VKKSDLFRTVLLVALMALLMIPRGIMTLLSAMILVIPVAYTGIKGQSRTFNLWAVYILAFFAFAYLRDIADVIGPVFVRYPIVLDQILAGPIIPTVQLQQRFYSPGTPQWWDYAALGIHLSYFLAIPGLGLLLWRFRPAQLRPVLLGMVGVFGLSILTHVLCSTAPPWIAAQMGLLPTVYRPVSDLLGGLTPGFYEYGLSVAGGNDVAAMPSVHAAAATMTMLGAWRTPWMIVGGVYTGAMGLALVYLGEHYVVDVLAGAGLALLCWRWVREV
jgi:membrane-associated phospholipid phosphatase